MEHVEVRQAHLLTFSLVQLGAIVLGVAVVFSLIAGVVIWRRGRRSR